MTKTSWVEVVCDYCGWSNHFLHPFTNYDTTREGYILRGRKHFCSPECVDSFDKEQEEIER